MRELIKIILYIIIIIATVCQAESKLVPEVSVVNFPDHITCHKDKDTLISISNNSESTITIYHYPPTGPFSIIAPSFPFNLPPYSTEQFAITFGTSFPGYYDGGAKIPYFDGNNYDTLSIRLVGKVIEPLMRTQYNEINFPHLAMCEGWVDTTMKIYNIGETVIWMDQTDQPINDTVRFLNLPLSVEAGDSIDLMIRFNPILDGDYSFRINVEGNPCSLLSFISINGAKSGEVFIEGIDTLDFGQIIDCGQPDTDTITREVTLNIHSQSDAVDERVIDLDIGGNFATDLNVGDLLPEETKFNIHLLPNANGVYDGEMTITMEPCDIKKKIYFRAERISPQISYNNRDINYGVVQFDSSAYDTLELVNYGSLPIVLDSIDGLAPPFFIDSTGHDFPETIQPGDTSVFVIYYFSPIISQDSSNIWFRISDPCLRDSMFSLKAAADEFRLFDIQVKIEDTHSGAPGDYMRIPIRIESSIEQQVSVAEISRIYLHLSFNPSILMLDNLEAGYSLNDPQITLFEYDEYLPGKIFLNMEIDNSTLAVQGEYAIMYFRTFLGNDIQTEIIIDSADMDYFVPIEIEKLDGRFTLSNGICQMEQRTIELQEGNYIYSTNSINGTVKVNYNIISQDKTEISLYNSYGELIEEFANNPIKPGDYELTIRSEKLSNGIYFLIVRTGCLMKHSKVLIHR